MREHRGIGKEGQGKICKIALFEVKNFPKKKIKSRKIAEKFFEKIHIFI